MMTLGLAACPPGGGGGSGSGGTTGTGGLTESGTAATGGTAGTATAATASTAAGTEGGTGHTCAANFGPGWTQTPGGAVRACVPGLVLCGTECVDLRSDAAHCGTCATTFRGAIRRPDQAFQVVTVSDGAFPSTTFDPGTGGLGHYIRATRFTKPGALFPTWSQPTPTTDPACDTCQGVRYGQAVFGAEVVP